MAKKKRKHTGREPRKADYRKDVSEIEEKVLAIYLRNYKIIWRFV